MSNGFKTKRLLVKPHEKSKITSRPTLIDSLYKSDDDYEEKLQSFHKDMVKLQTALYAEHRQSLLVIFQGMDTSGKDSAIEKVFSGLNPQGLQVTSFARPSEEDLDHDFLWRTHMRLPPRGKIGIFNRSYYEEVFAVRARPDALRNQRLLKKNANPKTLWSDRFEDIRNYELYLTRQGTTILKLLLHISRKEQLKRLDARKNDPEKRWKYDPKDLADRKLWPRYATAFNDCLPATSTKQAPWYVIPGDDKKNARLMIAQLVLEKLKEMDPQFP